MGIFNSNLKRLRILAGWKSAKKFAEALGIPYHSYMNYENKNNEPQYAILCRIADVLKCSTDELLGHTPNISLSPANDDPYLAKIRAASAAAAAAAVASLGISPTDAPAAADDLTFNKLRSLVEPTGFAIKKDPDTRPDPKFGDAILIISSSSKKVSKDFLYRAYLLTSRMRQGADHLAFSTFRKQLALRYDPKYRASAESSIYDNPDCAILFSYESDFETKISPLSPEEIKAIAEGLAPNPMIKN